MTLATRIELDLAPVAPAARSARLLEAFDGLPEGGGILLRSDGDLRPLFDELRSKRAPILGWYPLEEGEERRAEVLRLRPKDAETSIFEFYGRDHDEIDAILIYLRQDLERAVGQGRAAPAEALRAFDEFDRRLSLHIRWEEQILFPSVEDKHPPLADGPGAVMRMEHCKIHHFKGQAADLLRSGTPGPERIREALAFIDHMLGVLVPHNHKEESIYYPMSEQVFSPEEKAGVLAATRQMT